MSSKMEVALPYLMMASLALIAVCSALSGMVWMPMILSVGFGVWLGALIADKCWSAGK